MEQVLCLLEGLGVTIELTASSDYILKCRVLSILDSSLLKNIQFQDHGYEFEDEFYDDANHTLLRKGQFLRKRIASGHSSFNVVHQGVIEENNWNYRIYKEIQKSAIDLEQYYSPYLSYKFTRYHSQNDPNIYKDFVTDPNSFECISIQKVFHNLTVSLLLSFLSVTFEIFETDSNRTTPWLPVCSKFVQSLRTSPKYYLYTSHFEKFDFSAPSIQQTIKKINDNDSFSECVSICYSLYLWHMDLELYYFQTAWSQLKLNQLLPPERNNLIDNVFQDMKKYKSEILDGTREVGRDTIDDYFYVVLFLYIP